MKERATVTYLRGDSPQQVIIDAEKTPERAGVIIRHTEDLVVVEGDNKDAYVPISCLLSIVIERTE